MTNESKNGINKSYTYDGNGIRQAKSVNGVYTQHILDGANVIADVSGENVTKYNRGVTGLISSTANNTTSYYYTDYHGNVTQFGTTAYDYDAFGNQTTMTNNANPFRYCGEYYDAETGLIYLRARYYDSAVGAFVSEDPIKDGLNWYAYCAGNPVNFWDPWGLWEPGDENYPQWAQDAITQYTEDWEKADKAGDEEGKNKAHEGAEAIRKRVKAVEIAMYYDDKTYYENGFHYYDSNVIRSDGSDCTNFVSICLNGAGIPMTEGWYWKSYFALDFLNRSITDASPSWLQPDPFYRYFTEKENATVIGYIPKGTSLNVVPNGVMPGDVIAFNKFDDAPQGYINHIGIVTSIQDDGIHYSGHSGTRTDYPLWQAVPDYNGDIYIVKINY